MSNTGKEANKTRAYRASSVRADLKPTQGASVEHGPQIFSSQGERKPTVYPPTPRQWSTEGSFQGTSFLELLAVQMPSARPKVSGRESKHRCLQRAGVFIWGIYVGTHSICYKYLLVPDLFLVDSYSSFKTHPSLSQGRFP